MEGTESKELAESLISNPQLFTNEVLNNVDDLVNGAFEFFHQEAAKLLEIEGTDRINDLSKGVGLIHNVVRSVLDNQLDRWEKHCLQHYFAVPEGFSLPKDNEPAGETSLKHDAQGDSELDMQLESLRSKITEVQKESAGLNEELQELERIPMSNTSVTEAVQLYEQYSLETHSMFQDMTKSALDLREKMENLKRKRIEDCQRRRAERIYNPTVESSIGPWNVELQDIQAFLTDINRN